MFSSQDEHWMQHALTLAAKAAAEGEVPIGAILVRDNRLVAESWNMSIKRQDPTAHAEIVVLREGAMVLNNYRLLNTTLYTTLEPCMMCAGALIHARIERLIYGAADPKAGAIVSQLKLLEEPFVNHRIRYDGGLCAAESTALLQAFFKARR